MESITHSFYRVHLKKQIDNQFLKWPLRILWIQFKDTTLSMKEMQLSLRTLLKTLGMTKNERLDEQVEQWPIVDRKEGAIK